MCGCLIPAVSNPQIFPGDESLKIFTRNNCTGIFYVNIMSRSCLTKFFLKPPRFHFRNS